MVRTIKNVRPNLVQIAFKRGLTGAQIDCSLLHPEGAAKKVSKMKFKEGTNCIWKSKHTRKIPRPLLRSKQEHKKGHCPTKNATSACYFDCIL